MKLKAVMLLVIASAFASPAAVAQRMTADDFKWISACMADNKNEPGATEEKVRIYCVCMNNKMDDNETPIHHRMGKEQSAGTRGL